MTNDEGHMHRRRSKVTKMNYWSCLANYYTHRHHTWYQGTIQKTTSFLPWLKVKVTTQGQWSQTWRCLRSLNASCFFTPPRNRGGVIFSLQSVCLSVCLCVCMCVRQFLWTKFQPNGFTDLDAVFANGLLNTLARTLLKLVTLGQSYLISIFSS